MNPPTLIKSEQPIDRDGQIVNSFELESYNKDLQEGESPLLDPGELSNYHQGKITNILQKIKLKMLW